MTATRREMALYRALDTALHHLAGLNRENSLRMQEEREALRRVFEPPTPKPLHDCPECLGIGYIADEQDIIVCECQIGAGR